MSNEHEVRAEQEIDQVNVGRTHVVLLGAGASRAAFPNGERSGKQLPVMKDFYRHIPVGPIFKKAGLLPEMNFEEAYSKIASNPKLAGIRKELEETSRCLRRKLMRPLQRRGLDDKGERILCPGRYGQRGLLGMWGRK